MCAFDGNRIFPAIFTRCGQLPLWISISIRSLHSQPTPWRAILILAYHLHLSLVGGLFLGVTTRPQCALIIIVYRVVCMYTVLMLTSVQRSRTPTNCPAGREPKPPLQILKHERQSRIRSWDIFYLHVSSWLAWLRVCPPDPPVSFITSLWWCVYACVYFRRLHGRRSHNVLIWVRDS